MTEKATLRIPGYGLCSQIGKGASGIVYGGFDEKHGCRTVAIKCIRRSDVNQRQKLFSYVRSEREIHARLHHPAIVQFVDAFEDENYFYLVTEKCERDLDDQIKNNGKMVEELAKSLFHQIASGVHYLHDSSLHDGEIIHRDLKAGNIFLKADADGRYCAKIGDFGLATISDGDSLHKTVVGTPAYMPPEIHHKKRYGAEVDIWSLGMLLYYMLVGALPKSISSCQNLEEIGEVVTKRQIDLSTVTSSSARDLIATMLQRDPVNRHTLKKIMQHEWLTPRGGSVGSQTLDSGHGLSFGSSNFSSQLSPRNASYLSAGKRVLNTIDEQSFMDEGPASLSRSSPPNVKAPAATTTPVRRSAAVSDSLRPLSTEGLKPVRMVYDDLNFVASILESGEVVLEFTTLLKGHRRKTVGEVVRITGDGKVMYQYLPDHPPVEKYPPALPPSPSKYHISDIPSIDRARRKYSTAARFVDLVKTKVYKSVAQFKSESTGRAKCYLMRNEPNPNVETSFVDFGVKIVHTYERVLVKQANVASYSRYELAQLTRNLPDQLKAYWDHHTHYRRILLEGEHFLVSQQKSMPPDIRMLSIGRPLDKSTSSASSGNAKTKAGPPMVQNFAATKSDSFSREVPPSRPCDDALRSDTDISGLARNTTHLRASREGVFNQQVQSTKASTGIDVHRIPDYTTHDDSGHSSYIDSPKTEKVRQPYADDLRIVSLIPMDHGNVHLVFSDGTSATSTPDYITLQFRNGEVFKSTASSLLKTHRRYLVLVNDKLASLIASSSSHSS